MAPSEQKGEEYNPTPIVQRHPQVTDYLKHHRTSRQHDSERKASKRSHRLRSGTASKSDSKDNNSLTLSYDKSSYNRVQSLLKQEKYQECWKACQYCLYDPHLPRLVQMDLLCIMGKLKISKAEEFYDLALQMWDEVNDRSTLLRAFRTQCVQEKEELMVAVAQGLPDLVKHGEVDEDHGLRSADDSCSDE